MPAFAVGRTQELVYALNELKRQGRLPPIRVFVDSPLAINVTEVFKLHPECFDAEARAFLEKHGDVFGFDGIEYVSSREESIALNHLAGPAMIISAAGCPRQDVCSTTLKNSVEDDAQHRCLVVGFMAQHTLGRRLVERPAGVAHLRASNVTCALHVAVLDSFSAHADRRDLLAYAEACGKGVRRFFLVHGELPAQESLRQSDAAA